MKAKTKLSIFLSAALIAGALMFPGHRNNSDLRGNDTQTIQVSSGNQVAAQKIHDKSREDIKDYTPKKRLENNIQDILEEIRQGKEYIVVGETHPDESIEYLIIRLINEGSIKSLFLEALKKGSYSQERDSLKDLDGVYGWNPKKYDRIIKIANNKGLKVYGIDSHGKRAEGGKETSGWASYIIANGKKGCNLILVGSGHVNYWHIYSTKEDFVPTHLVSQGIPSKKILTIISYEKEKCETTLYKLKNLPKDPSVLDYLKEHRIADYIWICPEGNRWMK